MKIAVCFSGLPRFFESGFSFFNENLFKKYKPDIFIHTWYQTTPLEVKNLLNLYNPIDYKIEQNNTLVIPTRYILKGSERYPTYNIYSLFKSILEVNNLKTNYEKSYNFIYDWVFRVRFDYALNVKFSLEKLDNSLLYLPMELEERNLVTDQFAFSNSINMNVYSEVYNFLTEYFDQQVPVSAENALTAHLTKNNLKSKIIRCNMHHLFKPKGWDSLPHSMIREVTYLED